MNIKTLAHHLDLSIGTVSRALNGKPDVSAATRKRVLEAAVELGYSANASGRSLRRGTTQTIAFMLETGQSDLRSGDNFFMRVIDAMQATLAGQGYDLVILPCHSSSDPTEYLQRVIARGMADAIIVTATRRDDPRIALLSKSRLPFLTLGRTAQADTHPWIDLDFEGILDRTLQELASLGHKRIAVTVPEGGSNIASLLREAYAASHARIGLPCDTGLVIPTEVSEYGGNAVTRHILGMPDRPTALILNYELMAFGVYTALTEAGLAAGRDLSVAAFRRSRQLRFLHPTITTCDMDIEALGTTLAQETLALLQDPDRRIGQLWPFDFVRTDSLGPAP